MLFDYSLLHIYICFQNSFQINNFLFVNISNAYFNVYFSCCYVLCGLFSSVFIKLTKQQQESAIITSFAIGLLHYRYIYRSLEQFQDRIENLNDKPVL